MFQNIINSFTNDFNNSDKYVIWITWINFKNNLVRCRAVNNFHGGARGRHRGSGVQKRLQHGDEGYPEGIDEK